VAAGTTSGNVVLWDTSTGRPLQTELADGPSRVVAVAFSPDGQALAVRSQNGTIRIYSPFPGAGHAAAVIARLCRVAGQNLSGADWFSLLPNTPYHETCPNGAIASDAESGVVN
jgi:WD40 repeat protein